MDSSSSSEPLLLPPHKKLLLNSPSLLCSLPEHQELSIPTPNPTAAGSTSSFKDLLIFGPTTPPSPDSSSSWIPHHRLHRSRTAPAISAIHDVSPCPSSPPPPRRSSLVRLSLLLLSAYLLLGVSVYSLFPSHFTSPSPPTHPVADALYFCIVTMCTIGYGDITPSTPFAKLFAVSFVLFAFGFLDILLTSMLSYVLDLQQSLILSSLLHRHRNRNYLLLDVKKGRMRIRMKVALALLVVFLCIGIGTAVLVFVEGLGPLDSFYLAVMSVTTVGYGDTAFKTLTGRLFASGWLLVSTLAVARAFLYLAEARVDRRHRQIAKFVLSRDMTVSEFLAADIDNNGFVTKSEFVIYKLKEMQKITEKDIMQICEQFERLDTGNCGKITLSDLTESHLL